MRVNKSSSRNAIENPSRPGATPFPNFTLILLLVFVTSCDRSAEPTQGQALFDLHCSACHLPPDPGNIPREIWKKQVLPEMAIQMGYKGEDDDPLEVYSMEEELFGSGDTGSPATRINQQQWQAIQRFIMEQAPDSLPVDRLRSNRNSMPDQFTPNPLSIGQHRPAEIVSLQFNKTLGQFFIGDSQGRSDQWPLTAEQKLHFNSPITFQLQKDTNYYVLVVGFMNPSEEARGAMYRIGPKKTDTLAVSLHRPVNAKIVDLDNDGTDEVLICEFGNLTGQLSLLQPLKEKKPLLQLPGSIKVEITDLNGDGRKDIVVLASQGIEGIYALYQEGDLNFRLETLIELGPEYGSSWFQLVDYNADNHQDIVLVNGDNADFSIFPKGYHGLRLYLNDGKNRFEQKWFYPIYGATRVLAEDFDLDGDLDFAVLAFFPDFRNSPEEGFVYLENQSGSSFDFKSFTFPAVAYNRWLVMEKGDYDQDGDLDILLGANSLSIDRENFHLTRTGQPDQHKLLLLENNAVEQDQ